MSSRKGKDKITEAPQTPSAVVLNLEEIMGERFGRY